MKNLNILFLIAIFLTFSSCEPKPEDSNLDSGLLGVWSKNNSNKKLSFSSNGKCTEWTESTFSSHTYDWYVEGPFIHFYNPANPTDSEITCVYELWVENTALGLTCPSFDGNWTKD